MLATFSSYVIRKTFFGISDALGGIYKALLILSIDHFAKEIVRPFAKGQFNENGYLSTVQSYLRYFSEANFIGFVLCKLSGATQHGLDRSRC